MYIPIPLLIYILMSVLVGYKMEKYRREANAQWRKENKIDPIEYTIMAIMFSPFVIAWFLFKKMFLEDWD